MGLGGESGEGGGGLVSARSMPAGLGLGFRSRFTASLVPAGRPRFGFEWASGALGSGTGSGASTIGSGTGSDVSTIGSAEEEEEDSKGTSTASDFSEDSKDILKYFFKNCKHFKSYNSKNVL